MLAPFPVICGVSLSNKERLLIEYWLEGTPELERHDTLPVPSRLSDGKLHLVWQLEPASAAVLSEWGIPTLLILGSEAGKEDLHKKIYNSGISAVWELPSFGGALVFPDYVLPDFRGQIFATSGDETLLRHYRQIAAFAGLDLRTDFRNADELLNLLEELFLKKSQKKSSSTKVSGSKKSFGFLPRLLIVDLDAQKIDALRLFSGLESLLSQGVRRKEELPLLVSKDFERPGLDLRRIDYLVRPWTQRIFHPTESLKFLFEVLFLSFAFLPSNLTSFKKKERTSVWRKNLSASTRFYTLKELLYSEKAELCIEEPSFLPQSEPDLLRARRIEPFRWMYRYHKQSRFRGLVLSDAS